MGEKVTVPNIVKKKHQNQKITCLTAYDYSFARILDQAGIDILLVGDSLGCVFQGQENTLPVTLDEMIYHTRAVVRGRKRAQWSGICRFSPIKSAQNRRSAMPGDSCRRAALRQ